MVLFAESDGFKCQLIVEPHRSHILYIDEADKSSSQTTSARSSFAHVSSCWNLIVKQQPAVTIKSPNI